MARTPKFRDEDILEAAREVFLSRGVGATTAEVAERAGVSEGTVFHHFKTRSALFRAAVNPGELDEPPEIGALPLRIGKGEVRENLLAFCSALHQRMRRYVPFLMLALANADEAERKRMVDQAEPAQVRVVRLVASYVEGEARIGRFTHADPEIVARLLIGGIFDFARAECCGGQQSGLPLPSAMYLRGLVDIILHGISTRAAASSPPARKRRR